MSNDYFKAQGWFKNYATSSEDSRGVFQELVKEDEEAFRLASAKSDKIKAMMNEQYGPGTIKYGSEIKQPEIKTPQAAFEFSQRNPAAEGGRMGFYKGTDPELMKLFKQLVKKQAKRSVKQIGWNREKLLNLSNYLNNTGKTLDEYLKMNPSDRNKVNKAELTGVGKGAGQTETETTKKFRKWLAKQDPKTLKADSVQDLIRQANIEGVSMDKGTVKGIPRDKIISIVRENPQFENVTIRNWNEMDKVSDTVFTRSYEPDNPKYSGVYETTSKTGNKTYYGLVQRNKDVIKEYFSTPEEAADFVTEERKNPTSQELAGEKKIEERDFPNRKTPSKKRIDALKENSSYAFEKATTGDLKSNTVGGHTGSIYAETQTPKTKKYTDSRINAALENYDNALSAITEKRDAALKAGDFAEVERLNQKGMNYAAATEGYKTFTVRNMDGTSFLSGSTDKGAVDFMDLMDPNITAKDITNFGTAYGGQNAPVNKAKFELKNALEKYGKNSEEVKAAKQNLMDINAVEQEKLFREGTNKSLLEVQREPGMKSSKLTKPEVEATIKRLQSNFEDLRKNPNKTITDKKIIDYITDTTGKVKQPMFSSGFAGAYEMLSDDLKKIVDSEGFKKFSASKTAKGLSTVARAPGKLFGLGDVLLGYLDYTNNKPMMSEAKAYQSMLQAMSFNIYKGGDKQNLLEIKEKFLANGGDGKIFDQVIELNKSNYDMKKYIENAQERYQTLSTTGLETDKKRAKEEMQSAVNNIKMMGEKGLDKFAQYKTDLAVSESGGPIQIKGVTQPIKDTKKAAFDLFEEEQIKNYPSTYDQVNTGSGPVAEQIYNSILTKDSYKKLLPQNIPSTINQLLGLNFKPVTENEKEAALIKEMKKNAPQELYRYNKEFRDMDPDKPMTIEETANFMNKNKKAIGFSKGGITGLRSKYEYKK